jgi:hypothetical protein
MGSQFSRNLVLLFSFSLIFLFLLVSSISCKDSVTDPPEEKPPGYQEDIPWPSLADSPWPMYRCDPQNTGRNKSMTIINNTVNSITNDSLFIYSSAAIGSSGEIYFAARSFADGNTYLYSFSKERNLIWKFPLSTGANNDISSPLIATDGTIYISSPIQLRFYAVNKNGTEKWHIDNIEVKQSGINIGKDGTIYFLGLQNGNISLYAISTSGSILWTYQNNNFRGSELNSMSFSPDGNTLYIPGKRNEQAVFAFDVINKTIKWEFGSDRGIAPPVVDSYGNIYCVTDSANSIYLFSLNSNGNTRWKFRLNENYSGSIDYDIALDKQGNSICIKDTLYSINFRGGLNWKLFFENLIDDPVSLDKDKIFIKVNPMNPQLYIISTSGVVEKNIPVGNTFRFGYPITLGDNFAVITGFQDSKLFTVK